MTAKSFCDAAVKKLYGAEGVELSVSKTRKEFEGDFTLVTFPLLKISRKNPEATANEIGEFVLENWGEVIESFNVIKGFLNLKFKASFWNAIAQEIAATEGFGYGEKNGKTVLVEYSSPNTNKPLHLGHVRNNLLGYSVARILEAAGSTVYKVNLVNDRGIHICKSMVAWKNFGGGETPESSNMKGDHLVGKYYVEFDKAYKAQIKELTEGGMSEDEAKKEAPIMKEASAMLLKWEKGDSEVVELWKTMNEWVYAGFDKTYKEMGVSFDKTYYESQTYLLGKRLVEDGLSRGVFYRRDDNSVWIDLTEDGLDEKLLLRGDGTSVYMTQDLGTALERQKEYNFDDMTYVVGNEQNYHFDVLKLILRKLGYEWSDAIYHLSYGMVELPAGKMKSREGTVVDADDLMAAMVSDARAMSAELGKLDGLSEEESHTISRLIGLGALKYFILKVDPKKTMLFNPAESIDFNGNTAPFIQYTFARICSLGRRAEAGGISGSLTGHSLIAKEEELVKLLSEFPTVLQEAAAQHSPSVIAAYCYELAKEYNQYYHDNPILKEGVEMEAKQFRLALSLEVAKMLEKAMALLGIELPERM
ncbi:MAG: arginine--tRNA ligase [Rikenellaceae bacterium]